MADVDRDTPLRLTAFEHVRRLSETHDHLTATELKPGFVFGLPDRIYGCNWFYEGQFTLLARRNVSSFRAVASAERCSVCVA